MDKELVFQTIENPSPVSIIGIAYAGLAPALRGDYMMKKVLKNEDLIVVELIEKMELVLLGKMEKYLSESNGQDYLALGNRK